MVKKIVKGRKKYYFCSICKLVYIDKKVAEKCEEWCSTYGSCSLEITKNAVKI